MLRLNSVFKKLALLCVCISCFGNLKANVISFSKNAKSVTFKLDKGLMQLNICKADIIEVKYTIFNSFPTKESLVVNNKWPLAIAFTVADGKSEVIITTAKLRIKINKATNAITYCDLNGKVITAEASSNKSMSPATIAGIETYNVSTSFNSPANEALYGMGCHPLDSLSINYKGRDQDMAIKYLTGAIPVMLSTKATV
jgi:alpha-D-xyloside xylohydrolase